MVERYRGRGSGSKKTPAEGTHRVGYRSPPRHSLWVPGQSGNPSGKPRGVLNLKTELIKELNSLITVRKGNRTIRVKKGQAWIMKIVNGALSNDVKATATLIQLLLRFDVMGQMKAGEEAPLTSNDAELLADWLQRQLGDLGNEAAQARSAQSDNRSENTKDQC